MTAQPFEPTLAAPRPHADAHSLRGIALVTVLVFIMAVAAAVLATVEWIAPTASAAVPG